MEKEAFIDSCKKFAYILSEIREIPSGHLYAKVMEEYTLDQFQMIIELLIKAKLIKLEFDYITFIG